MDNTIPEKQFVTWLKCLVDYEIEKKTLQEIMGTLPLVIDKAVTCNDSEHWNNMKITVAGLGDAARAARDTHTVFIANAPENWPTKELYLKVQDGLNAMVEMTMMMTMSLGLRPDVQFWTDIKSKFESLNQEFAQL